MTETFQRDGFAIGRLGKDGQPSGFYFRAFSAAQNFSSIWVIGADRGRWFASENEASAFVKRNLPNAGVYFGKARR